MFSLRRHEIHCASLYNCSRLNAVRAVSDRCLERSDGLNDNTSQCRPHNPRLIPSSRVMPWRRSRPSENSSYRQRTAGESNRVLGNWYTLSHNVTTGSVFCHEVPLHFIYCVTSNVRDEVDLYLVCLIVLTEVKHFCFFQRTKCRTKDYLWKQTIFTHTYASCDAWSAHRVPVP